MLDTQSNGFNSQSGLSISNSDFNGLENPYGFNLQPNEQILSPLSLDSGAITALQTVSIDNILTESFTGSNVTQSSWIFGSSGSATAPILTARSGPATPGGIPGGGTAIDAPGSGVLRLTNNEPFQASFVVYNQPITSASGLSINFDLYAYGGDGGDGITFFLSDSNSTPTTPGGNGGSLGYSGRGSTPGIAGGYIGIGFDEFGNFSSPDYGSGGPGNLPDSVVIRGSEATGYKYLTGTTLPAGTSIDNPGPRATHSNSKRNVQIDITPTGLVSVQMDLNNNGNFEATERLISDFNVTTTSANNAPLPSTFKFGFSGSTADSNNYHEINNLKIDTLTGPYVPLVNFATTNGNTVAENGNLVITAQLDRPTSNQVVVPLTFTGTAANGTDYTIPTSITFAPNQTTGSVTLTSIDNTVFSYDKTVTFGLGTPTNGQLSPQNNSFTVAILDNDSFLQGSFNFENQLRVQVNRGQDLTNLLFDERYYLDNNRDVATAVTNGQFSSGLQHFLQFGQFEGRDPSVIFSNSLYLSYNPDVAVAVATGVIRSGFEHFVNFGFKSYEHRDLRMLSFDEGYYLAQNQDVRSALNTGIFRSGYEHYLLFGQKEGRSPSAEFSEAYYLATNRDVKSAVDRGEFQSGFDHYVRFGIFEGRNPINTFNSSQYLSTNSDVATAVTQGNFFRSGVDHAVRFGKYEGRAFLPQLFDERYYLTQNPDVASAVTSRVFTGGLDHFTLFGQRENRLPSTSYNESYYLTQYPDVANAIARREFASGFDHFILFGRAEGRLGVGSAISLAAS